MMAETPTPQMDPWRFMAALTVAMQQSKVPPPATPTSPPRPSSTVQ